MLDYCRGNEESVENYAARLRSLLEQRDLQIQDLKRQLEDINLAVPEAAEMSDTFGQLGDHNGSSGVLTEVEALLAERSQAAQNPSVLQLLAGLQAAAVYTDTPNHETNRKLWDAYAKGWGADEEWVQRMASHLPGPVHELRTVGDEWSDESSLVEVLKDWLFPHVVPEARLAEVGSGGGRVAAKVAGRVRELVCFDISSEMLAVAEKHLVACGFENLIFEHVQGDASYPRKYNSGFDFVYSFDVFVHMDLHQMRHTLSVIRELLKPGSYCFVSFANLLAPDGWRRFARQKQFTVGGFYFVSPEIVRCLVTRVGLEICKVSKPQGGNTYLNRDLLVLARRPVDASAMAKD